MTIDRGQDLTDSSSSRRGTVMPIPKVVDEPVTDAKEAPVNPLRAWRLKNRVSQFAAAARLGVSASILKEWEAGSVTPRPERFERIAALMGTDAEALRRAWERWQRQVQIRA